MKFSAILITVVFLWKVTECAKILAVLPNPFYSHQATFRPLWRELARRGHEITLFTTDPMEQNDNITQIDSSRTYKMLDELGMKELMINGLHPMDLISKFIENGDRYFTNQLTHPGLVELIEKREKFDHLFIELWTPYFTTLCHLFKAPFIGLSTMDAHNYHHGLLGNAMHPAMYPYVETGFEIPLTFRERLLSTAVTLGYEGAQKYFFSWLFRNFTRKYLSEDNPTNLFQDNLASLVFLNANPIFYPPRPVTPVTINLEGGLHLTGSAKLPKDLQTYLDDSKDGCIYFSLGSTVNSDALSMEVIEMFRKTFEELKPIRILWKFENETLPNKPKNLEIRKWLPQQDVLRHPNIKLFITQGGLQSMEEGIDSAVPMLGMPFYGDQVNNVNKMVSKKFGLSLDVKTMDQKDLKNTILELLNNPLYKKIAEKYSRIQRDRPMTAVQKAVWWTEYVLRHGGTAHLKSPSVDIPLYQYFFLDIMAFVVVVLVVMFVVFYYFVKMIRALFRKLFKSKEKKNKKKIN